MADGMTILVAGASGATGRLLVKQLLDRGVKVRALVRSPEGLAEALRNHPGLTLVVAGVLDLPDAEMAALVRDCGAVVSCLGHPMTFKGVFGHPRRLVTEVTRRLCEAIQANSPEAPVRFVLMNTAGNSNRDLDEVVSFRSGVSSPCFVSAYLLTRTTRRPRTTCARTSGSGIGRSSGWRYVPTA